MIIILVIIFVFLSAFIKAAAKKEIEEKELISINLKNVELERALIMLANTADKNLICDQSVEGQITVIFNDVDFEDALELITDSFDLDFIYQKDVIYVSSLEKLNEKKKKIITKNFRLKYLNSEKAVEILNNNLEEIKIINLKSDGLIINCSEKDMSKAEKIIEEIDRPQKQVMIKARVEEISRTKIKELGINPDQLSEIKIIKNSEGNIDKLKLSWPEALRILNEEGLSNVLANPSLMTLDRKKAKLIIGDQIPVKLESVVKDQIVSSLNYIEAGIVLEFLPKIINKQQVMLEIKPSVNSIGQVLADGLPAVNSRSAETTVILENGETLAVGGLIKKDELKTVKELPLLAELPILGRLFSRKDKTNIETELIIFITPEIIENKRNDNLENRNAIRSSLKNKKTEINKDKKEELQGVKKNKNNKEFKTLSKKELKEILDK